MRPAFSVCTSSWLGVVSNGLCLPIQRLNALATACVCATTARRSHRQRHQSLGGTLRFDRRHHSKARCRQDRATWRGKCMDSQRCFEPSVECRMFELGVCRQQMNTLCCKTNSAMSAGGEAANRPGEAARPPAGAAHTWPSRARKSARTPDGFQQCKDVSQRLSGAIAAALGKGQQSARLHLEEQARYMHSHCIQPSDMLVSEDCIWYGSDLHTSYPAPAAATAPMAVRILWRSTQFSVPQRCW